MRSGLLGLIVAIVFLVTFSPMVMVRGLDMQKVDQCLGLGGSFNYGELRCDLTADHAFVPFAVRNPMLVRMARAGAVAMVALATLGLITRRRRASGPWAS